jgi:YggT family protein
MWRRFQPSLSGIMEHPVIWLILTLLNLYFWVILITVIMSWLIGFNVINGANPYVRQISYALHRLTEPLLGPIRRFLPDLGGIDISPIFLLLALQFLQYAIVYYAARLL